MASFYNNYYRYYRPYSQPINKPYSVPDKSSLKSNDFLAFSEKASISKTQKSTFSDTKQAFDNEKNSSRSYSFGPINFKNPFFNDIEEPIFEILGIQLYLDDIIILGLLFFLYQEGVQDEMLFIALILLLLS